MDVSEGHPASPTRRGQAVQRWARAYRNLAKMGTVDYPIADKFPRRPVAPLESRRHGQWAKVTLWRLLTDQFETPEVGATPYE